MLTEFVKKTKTIENLNLYATGGTLAVINCEIQSLKNGLCSAKERLFVGAESDAIDTADTCFARHHNIGAHRFAQHFVHTND